MATWSLDANLSHASSQVQTDGVWIYFYDASFTGLKRYNYATGTVEEVKSSYPSTRAFTVFNGDLYVVRYGSVGFDDVIYVDRWDGTLDSFTEVFSFQENAPNTWMLNSGDGAALLTNDGVHMILVWRRSSTGSTSTEIAAKIRYTVDGDTWQEGDYSDNPGGAYGWTGLGADYPTTPVGNPVLGVAARFIGLGVSEKVYKWNRSTAKWDVQYPITTGSERLMHTGGLYFWRGTYTIPSFEYSNDMPASWNTPSTSGIHVAPKRQGTLAVGVSHDSGAYFRYWDTVAGDWSDAQEQVYLLSASPTCALMLEDKTLFMRISGWRVRSEPLDVDAGYIGLVAEFWQGQNGLGTSKRSDLPFNGVNAGAMAIKEETQNKEVVIGSDEAGSTMVVQGDSDDDYAAWTDITDNIDTDADIERVEVI